MFQFNVAFGQVEGHSGERGAHLKPAESRGDGSGLAGVKYQSADAAPRPGWMHEESADFCCVSPGIQERVFPAGPYVAAVECLTFTPSATGDNDHLSRVERCWKRRSFRRCAFDGEVGSVSDELAVNAIHSPQGGVELRGCVVLGL
jgi:hypothetical protein